MLVAILTIFVAALGAAGGAQELFVQGIVNNKLVPLVGGTLGVVSSSLMLAGGIALLRQSPRAVALTRASAWASLPVTVLLGFVWGLAGWPMRIVGIAYPAFLLAYFRKS
ncbi:MAG: hypothetical protein ACREUU_04105 [Gammaproteobacteria bacterium]